jgi:hypothetical protein
VNCMAMSGTSKMAPTAAAHAANLRRFSPRSPLFPLFSIVVFSPCMFVFLVLSGLMGRAAKCVSTLQCKAKFQKKERA